jgi:hypothetical protein
MNWTAFWASRGTFSSAGTSQCISSYDQPFFFIVTSISPPPLLSTQSPLSDAVTAPDAEHDAGRRPSSSVSQVLWLKVVVTEWWAQLLISSCTSWWCPRFGFPLRGSGSWLDAGPGGALDGLGLRDEEKAQFEARGVPHLRPRRNTHDAALGEQWRGWVRFLIDLQWSR